MMAREFRRKKLFSYESKTKPIKLNVWEKLQSSLSTFANSFDLAYAKSRKGEC